MGAGFYSNFSGTPIAQIIKLSKNSRRPLTERYGGTEPHPGDADANHCRGEHDR